MLRDDHDLRVFDDDGDELEPQGGPDEETTPLERFLYQLVWTEFAVGDLADLVDDAELDDSAVCDDPNVLEIARGLAAQLCPGGDEDLAGRRELTRAVLAAVAGRHGVRVSADGQVGTDDLGMLLERLEAAPG